MGQPNNHGSTIDVILRFPGQVADAHSALYYNYFRDYDPKTGRYVESDPIGLAGGLNTYGYVLGNPLGYSDSLGLATTVIYTSDGIDHTAVHITNPRGKEMLYDPNGGYRYYECDPCSQGQRYLTNPGPVFEDDEADLNKYLNHPGEYGPNTKTYTFNTTPEEEEEIARRILGMPTPGALSCARHTSLVIHGIGPFNRLVPTQLPWRLDDQLENLKGK